MVAGDFVKHKRIEFLQFGLIKEILFTIDSTQALLKNTENKLKELEGRRNEVSNIVDNLNSDGVTQSISDYLKRRGQNSWILKEKDQTVGYMFLNTKVSGRCDDPNRNHPIFVSSLHDFAHGRNDWMASVCNLASAKTKTCKTGMSF